MVAVGEIWSLHHGDRVIARLRVTDMDFPWVYADTEPLPEFDEFQSLFEEQEQALDEHDFERADTLYARIRSRLSMAFPDGRPVAEFMLHIYGDGTAGWRWHDQPFDGSG